MTCSRADCDRSPANGRKGYCREHRNAYQRQWRADRRAAEEGGDLEIAVALVAVGG